MEVTHANATRDMRKKATNAKVTYFVSIRHLTFRCYFFPRHKIKLIINYKIMFISDINECKTEIAGCNQICINADGGYSCGCYRGFTLDDDRSHCNKGLCVDICVSCNIECFYSYTYILLKQ